MIKLIFTFFILLFASQGFTQTVFTYIEKQDTQDERKNYNVALLKLALDKTVSSHGAYKLIPYAKMNYKRAEKTALDGKITNFIY